MKRLMIQQGDVLLRRVNESANEGKTIARGKCVIAHGESGHSHTVENDEAELIQIGDRMLLKLGQPATLKHQEHKEIMLEPALYEISRVNEYDYLSKMTRKVTD